MIYDPHFLSRFIKPSASPRKLRRSTVTFCKCGRLNSAHVTRRDGEWVRKSCEELQREAQS
jgi:hypothetical protein